ncbi:hypothetical protein STRDD10_01642 [Streptococcus sp. DD10]|nr:hypothetical protein STRDD10_01642 [Streptococcus sp. DD10]
MNKKLWQKLQLLSNVFYFVRNLMDLTSKKEDISVIGAFLIC